MPHFYANNEQSAMNKDQITKQYQIAKAAAGDALLLFRMDDFYELFHGDAKIAADALGLTITTRYMNDESMLMTGFPYHQLESYLAKLVALGYRVAVCERIEG